MEALAKQKDLLKGRKISFEDWCLETFDLLLKIFPKSGASKVASFKETMDFQDSVDDFSEQEQLRFKKELAYFLMDNYLEQIGLFGTEKRSVFRDWRESNT